MSTLDQEIETLNNKFVSPVTEFKATRNSSINRGDCWGLYNKQTNLVTLNFHFYHTADLTTSTTLFTVPSQYKPSSTKYGTLLFVNGGGTAGAYYCSINSSGIIVQNAGSTIRQGVGIIEYLL